MTSSKTVEEFIEKSGDWEDAVILLRELILDDELEEAIKWGAPAYLYNKKIVLGIAAFKKHVSIWFHQGVFLKNKEDKLVNDKTVTAKALRQWRFASVDEILKDKKIIRKYVKEAIANQKAGKEMKPAKKKAIPMPDEMKAFFKSNESVAQKFAALTPSKQREYIEHIAGAKQAATKERRLHKIADLILEGKGLNDKYK